MTKKLALMVAMELVFRAMQSDFFMFTFLSLCAFGVLVFFEVCDV